MPLHEVYAHGRAVIHRLCRTATGGQPDVAIAPATAAFLVAAVAAAVAEK